MRYFMLILLLVGGLVFLYGQEYHWDYVTGTFSTGHVIANDIAVCSNNNYYLTGLFSGDVVFGDETHTASSWTDFYVAKIDPEGNQWSWSKTPVGVNFSFGNTIAVDSDDVIIVGGAFSGAMNLDSINLTPGSSTTLSDAFLAKIDPEGDWLWAIQGGGDHIYYGDRITGVVTDKENNIYVVGDSSPNATYGNFDIPGYGSTDILVGKLDPYGNWLWVDSAGGGYEDRGFDIALDNNGDILITGFASGNATFGPFQVDNEGLFAFVAKLTSDGEWLWVNYTEIIPMGEFPYAVFLAMGRSIAVNSNNDVFFTGTYSGAINFGALSLDNTQQSSYDIPPRNQFVAAIDSDGEWLWVQGIDSLQSYHDRAIVRIDSSDSILLTGGFSGQISLGGNTLVSQGGEDFFVAEIDSAGELLWYGQVGGEDDAVNEGLAFDTNQNAVLTGTFTNTISFNGIGLEFFGPNHSVYSARLNRGQDLSVEDFTEPSVQSIFNYPNPFNPSTSIRFNLSTATRAQLDVYNTKGQLVKRLYDGDMLSGEHDILWDGRDYAGITLPSGIYFYQLSTSNENLTGKMLLLK